MTRFIALLTTLLFLGGCTALKERFSVPVATYSGKLSDAVYFLEKGNEPAATKILEELCNSHEKSMGVTDEALFRLSLLGLRRHNEPEEMLLLQKRLAKLRTDFPGSAWTHQALPLIEYLAEKEVAASEIRTVKQRNSTLSKENRELTLSNQQLQGTNQTLTKENKELSLIIEKLKSLDMELELKNRR
jgi:hypothetical protein